MMVHCGAMSRWLSTIAVVIAVNNYIYAATMLAENADQQQWISFRESTHLHAALPSNEIYSSEEVERTIQPLFNEERGKEFQYKARSKRVTSLLHGCGRMKNRLALLEDGTKVCCRYRENLKELRGDLYSYHFDNLLGLWNIPPTALVRVNFSSQQWSGVADAAKEAGWEDGSDVIMVLYVEGLRGEYVPESLKEDKTIHTQDSLQNLTVDEQSRIMQWTDMILFDFLIAHSDRLFNNLLNAQWNSHMMEKTIHNLERTASGNLVLIDNESGFSAGYTLAEKHSKYYELQTTFMKKVCIFRRKTIEVIHSLNQSGKGDALLEEYIHNLDPQSYTSVRKLNKRERENFRSRLRQVMDFVYICAEHWLASHK